MDEFFEHEVVKHIRVLLEEGLASGICTDEPETIIERIIAERKEQQVKKAER